VTAVNHSGRYAPSPTGDLHLGNLRTALLAWLFARSVNATFLLRIEDLDRARSRSEYELRQLGDLRALGIDWDGEPVRQSERDELYSVALGRLETYPCWCTRAEIREAISAPHSELPEGAYPGTCRKLSAGELALRRRQSRPPALRVRADGAAITFEDRLHGHVTGEIDDFVVRRNDGAYGYNLAVVVDDGDQAIGEVVRGDDLLSSTARQVWLGEQLGLPRHSYAHVPLVLGDDGQRLAKRHGAVTLADRIALGATPDQVRGLLAASVGLCAPGDEPSPPELISRFDAAAFAPPRSGPLPRL
jgi:glutamyl-tRNA synthetase